MLTGFRFEVGGDWYNYLDIFNNIRRRGFVDAVTQTDAAYGFLNWLAAEQGWGIWFPNLISAIVFTWGLIALARQQPNPALALVVSMYLIILVGMGFTRQAAALGFVMLAIVQYSRGATVRMLAYLALAAAFHASAVFVIPLFGLAAARRGVVVAAMFALLGALLALQFFGHFQDRFGLYTGGEISSAGVIPRLAMIVLPAAIFLSFPRRFTADPAQLRLWKIFALVSVLFVLLLFVFDMTTIVDRLGFYISPLQIFVLSRVPAAFGSQGRSNMFLLTLVIAASLLIVVGWLSLGRWGHAWIPYNNYLWEYASEGEWPRPGRRR